MIKCTARLEGGSHLLVLGLTDGNLERLRAGEPIAFDLMGLGLPWEGKVTIFHGRDEVTIERMLREGGLIGPGTEIVGDAPDEATR